MFFCFLGFTWACVVLLCLESVINVCCVLVGWLGCVAIYESNSFTINEWTMFEIEKRKMWLTLIQMQIWNESISIHISVNGSLFFLWLLCFFFLLDSCFVYVFDFNWLMFWLEWKKKKIKMVLTLKWFNLQ